jgi:uncharacterized membrane protein
MMYSWRVKWRAALVLLGVFVVLDRWVAGYAQVLREGNLTRVVCVGEVVDLNSGDILRFNDGTERIGRITARDMDGTIVFRDRTGEVIRTRQGLEPDEVARTEERQDQVLTVRVATWPRALRRQGVNLQGTNLVVGNVFRHEAFGDRVFRIGDRVFLDVPMKRLGVMERADVREYFRAPFLVRLGAVLSVAVVLVGGLKGVLTLVALSVSLALMLGILVPGILGDVAVAGANAAWLLGGTLFLAGVASYFWPRPGEEEAVRFRQRFRGPGQAVGVWLAVAVAVSAGSWFTVHVVGRRPVPLALFIALAATLLTFTIITGFSPKVISGSLGTVGGLAACAVVSAVASRFLSFTGLAVEFGYLEVGTLLWREPATRGWPFLDILTAGLIIAALGAMMDVSMSVSSTIYEVKRANPRISVTAAMRAGYNVGKDIMSTMTDTLIFAFIGADLIFVVLPGLEFPEAGRLLPFMRIFNEEEPAVGALHALLGTLGLVLAIPISAFIAGLLTAYMRIPGENAMTPAVPDAPTGPGAGAP